jgi:hypothetical protein
VPDSEAEDAGDDAAGGLGRRGAVGATHQGEQTVDGRDGDLQQAQLTEGREKVGVGDEAVQPLGARGPVAAVDVGQPAGGDGA